MLAKKKNAVVAERQTHDSQKVVGVNSSEGSNPFNRIYESDLTIEAFEKAKGHQLEPDIRNLLSIYNSSFWLSGLGIDWDAWNIFIDEVENTLGTFVSEGKLVPRTKKFSDIIGPVAERQTQRT